MANDKMPERICKNCSFHRDINNNELKSFLYNCTNEKRLVAITTFVYHNESCGLFAPIQDNDKESK